MKRYVCTVAAGLLLALVSTAPRRPMVVSRFWAINRTQVASFDDQGSASRRTTPT